MSREAMQQALEALTAKPPASMGQVEAIEILRSALDAPLPQGEPVAPSYAHDGVWEALQRMIEDGQTKGPASREDALTVARHRDRVLLLKAQAADTAAPKAPQPAAATLVPLTGVFDA